MKKKIEPIMSLYSQIKPLLLLPFNIWLFFVTIPFRLFFFLTSDRSMKSKKMEIKEEIKNIAPASLSHKAPIELRQRKLGVSDEDRQPGWYAVERSEKPVERSEKPVERSEKPLSRRASISKKSTAPSVISEYKSVEPSMSDEELLRKVEEHERRVREEKLRLESQLDDVTQRFEKDEIILATFDAERSRYKSLINFEREKLSKAQEEIAQLQSQLTQRSESSSTSSSSTIDLSSMDNLSDEELLKKVEEHEKRASDEKAALEAELMELNKKYQHDEELVAMYSTEKTRYMNLINIEQRKCFDMQQLVVKLRSQLAKAQSSSSSSSSSSTSTDNSKTLNKSTTDSTTTETTPQVNSVWHTAAKEGFTEMVAHAQQDELEHGKTFSEVLKDSIKKEEPTTSSNTAEFTVLGGADSTQHVFAPVSAN